MNRWLRMTVLAMAGPMLLVMGCAGGGTTPSAAVKTAAEAAIREADIAWSKTSEAKDLDAHVAYFSDDGAVLAPNEPVVIGRDSIRAKLATYFAMPGFSLKWQPTKVEASALGDMGWSMGTYEMTMSDPQGNPVADHGKYVSVWEKQADGAWKVAADMFNSDVEAPAPPAH